MQSLKQQPWHILGAGAIGCLFATQLHRKDAQTSLILRQSQYSSCEVTIEDEVGKRVCQLAVSSADDPSPIGRLLVTTKAYDVEAALESVRHRLHPDSQVLLLVNGMGLAELAAQMLPQVSLYCGTTTEGAYRIDNRHIRHAGRGLTRIGATTATDQPPWFSDWTKLDIECQWERQIMPALWHKMAINCAINPLTALHGCRNGELDEQPTLRAHVARLCDEISGVSAAAGFDATAATIHSDAVAVIHSTAGNRSSMLQDTQAKRRTEIDFITGYLVQRACELNVAVPENQALLERITQIDY